MEPRDFPCCTENKELEVQDEGKERTTLKSQKAILETELPNRLYGRRNGIRKINIEGLENKDQYMVERL